MTTRRALAVTLVYAVVAVAMFGWAFPGVETACGMPPLDGRLQWGADEAKTFVDACGAGGLAAYRRLQLLDLLYPVALAATLSSWAIRFAPRRWAGWLVVVPAAIAATCDYLENLAAWTVLGQAPGWDTSLPLRIAPIVSPAKNVFAITASSTLAVLVIAAIVVRLTRPRRRAGSPDQPGA